MDEPAEATPAYEIRTKLDEELEYFTRLALQETEKWIKVVTKKSFKYSDDPRKSLQDGVLLCELLNGLKPGCIRKINRLPTPIAYLDNLTVFQNACRDIFGLQEVQLFDIQDLEDLTVRGVLESEDEINYETVKRLRNVAITIFWLGKEVRGWYNGPQLNLQPFTDLVEQRSSSFYGPPSEQDRRMSATIRLSPSVSPSPVHPGFPTRRVTSPKPPAPPRVSSVGPPRAEPFDEGRDGKSPKPLAPSRVSSMGPPRTEPFEEGRQMHRQIFDSGLSDTSGSRRSSSDFQAFSSGSLDRGGSAASSQVSTPRMSDRRSQQGDPSEVDYASLFPQRQNSLQYSNFRDETANPNADYSSFTGVQPSWQHSLPKPNSNSGTAGKQRSSPLAGVSVKSPTHAQADSGAQINEHARALSISKGTGSGAGIKDLQGRLEEWEKAPVAHQTSPVHSLHRQVSSGGTPVTDPLGFVKASAHPLSATAKQTMQSLEKQKSQQGHVSKNEVDWESDLQSWKSRRRSQQPGPESEEGQTVESVPSFGGSRISDDMNENLASKSSTSRTQIEHVTTSGSGGKMSWREETSSKYFNQDKGNDLRTVNSEQRHKTEASLKQEDSATSPPWRSKLFPESQTDVQTSPQSQQSTESIETKFIERTIKISQSPHNGFGFELKGGKEFGQPITVSKITRGGAADVNELRAGDELIAINGALLANHYLESVNMVIEQAVREGQVELAIRRARALEEEEEDWKDEMEEDFVVVQKFPVMQCQSTSLTPTAFDTSTSQDEVLPPLPSLPPPPPNWNTFPESAHGEDLDVDYIDQTEATSNQLERSSGDRIFAVISKPNAFSQNKDSEKEETLSRSVSSSIQKTNKQHSKTTESSKTSPVQRQDEREKLSFGNEFKLTNRIESSNQDKTDIGVRKSLSDKSKSEQKTVKNEESLSSTGYNFKSESTICELSERENKENNSSRFSSSKTEGVARSSENTKLSSGETKATNRESIESTRTQNTKKLDLQEAWKKQQKDLTRAISDAEREFSRFRAASPNLQSSEPEDYSNQTKDYANQTKDYANQTKDYANQAKDHSNQSQDYSNQSKDYSNKSSEYNKHQHINQRPPKSKTSDENSGKEKHSAVRRIIPIHYRSERNILSSPEPEYPRHTFSDDEFEAYPPMRKHAYMFPNFEDQYDRRSFPLQHEIGKGKSWKSTEYLRSKSVCVPNKEEWLERMSRDIEDMLKNQSKLQCRSKRLDLEAERLRMIKWNEEQERKRMEHFIKELEELKRRKEDDLWRARQAEEQKQRQEAVLLEKEVAKQRQLDELKKRMDEEAAKKERTERLKREKIASEAALDAKEDRRRSGIREEEFHHSSADSGNSSKESLPSKEYLHRQLHRLSLDDTESDDFITGEVSVNIVTPPPETAQIQILPDSARSSMESLNTLDARPQDLYRNSPSQAGVQSHEKKFDIPIRVASSTKQTDKSQHSALKSEKRSENRSSAEIQRSSVTFRDDRIPGDVSHQNYGFSGVELRQKRTEHAEQIPSNSSEFSRESNEFSGVELRQKRSDHARRISSNTGTSDLQKGAVPVWDGYSKEAMPRRNETDMKDQQQRASLLEASRRSLSSQLVAEERRNSVGCTGSDSQTGYLFDKMNSNQYKSSQPHTPHTTIEADNPFRPTLANQNSHLFFSDPKLATSSELAVRPKSMGPKNIPIRVVQNESRSGGVRYSGSQGNIAEDGVDYGVHQSADRKAMQFPVRHEHNRETASYASGSRTTFSGSGSMFSGPGEPGGASFDPSGRPTNLSSARGSNFFERDENLHGASATSSSHLNRSSKSTSHQSILTHSSSKGPGQGSVVTQSIRTVEYSSNSPPSATENSSRNNPAGTGQSSTSEFESNSTNKPPRGGNSSVSPPSGIGASYRADKTNPGAVDFLFTYNESTRPSGQSQSNPTCSGCEGDLDGTKYSKV